MERESEMAILSEEDTPEQEQEEPKCNLLKHSGYNENVRKCLLGCTILLGNISGYMKTRKWLWFLTFLLVAVGTGVLFAIVIGRVYEEPPITSPGAVYTRWGRTVCPNNTKTIYDGYAGGSHYQEPGGMSDTLCLPKEPQWANFYEGVQTDAFMYGAEYNSDNKNPEIEAIFGKALYDQEVPCAVCEATGRVIHMMIPARTQCFDDWNLEYTGYLMAERSVHKGRTQAKCVDEDPEYLTGQSGNSDGNLFYFIEAAGQLPDPPYIKGRELTCVVCTK